MLGSRVLAEQKSKYNGNLRVVRTIGLGTYIQVQNLTQSGGVVEGFWKQTLRHLKLRKNSIKKVLILGLGGGTLVKLIKKNWPDSEITGVDIDPEIVKLGKKYLGLKDLNVKIKITDAGKFLVKSSVRDPYDLIIVDVYLGDMFPEKFEKSDFLMDIKHHLTHDGVAIFNRLYYKEKKTAALKFGQKLKGFFSKVEHYFPVSNIMFLCTP